MARMTVPEFKRTIVADGSNNLDSTNPTGGTGTPNAPTNFTASYLSDTSLSLAWTDNATNEDNFELDRSLTGTGGWTALSDPAANATSATSTGLTVDTQYFYRLRAVNTFGNSSYATANGTTTAASSSLPVYADRTKLATASASGGGDGSGGSPWTLDEAMTDAVAGDIVGVQAGVYVGTDPGVSAGNYRFTPAFRPTNSGTSGNPIIFVAQNQASKVTTNFSDIRSGSTVAGSGWPAFGALTRNYIEWVGMYTDETQSNNKGVADSGPCTMWTQTGSKIQGCKIRGEIAPTIDNHSGIRTENFFDGVLSDNDISGFNDQPGGGGTNQTGITNYTTHGTIIEYNLIADCGDGIYPKTGTSYGNTIRFNILSECILAGMRIGSNTLGPGNERSDVYQNLFIECEQDIEITQAVAIPAANNALDIFNNTTYNTSSAVDSVSVLLNDSVESHDNTMKNNIFYGTNRLAYFAQYSSGNSAQGFVDYIFPDQNCYFNAVNFADGTSGSDWNEIDFATWKSLTTADDLSQETDPLFTTNGSDFTLSGSSPCLDAGIDFKNLLGGGTSAAINQGAYITAGQTEVIGVR